jgi:hypothetical protein
MSGKFVYSTMLVASFFQGFFLGSRQGRLSDHNFSVLLIGASAGMCITKRS